MQIRWDGHTHTEMCPHGSGDSTAAMVEKAIRLGFTDYSITEHAPLPTGFRNIYVGDAVAYDTASLFFDQVDDYFNHVEELKETYKDKIRIHIGFEFDYIPGFDDECKAFLNEIGGRLDDALLSVHFMDGANDGFWCIDYSPEEFETGFGYLLKNPQELFGHYWKLVELAVNADWGKYTPKRIGHIDNIKKYQDYFGWNRNWGTKVNLQIDRILDTLAEQGRSLDMNVAGLYKPYCNDVCPGLPIFQRAMARKIPWVYGSDSHSIADVGHGHYITEFLEKTKFKAK